MSTSFLDLGQFGLVVKILVYCAKKHGYLDSEEAPEFSEDELRSIEEVRRPLSRLFDSCHHFMVYGINERLRVFRRAELEQFTVPELEKMMDDNPDEDLGTLIFEVLRSKREIIPVS